MKINLSLVEAVRVRARGEYRKNLKANIALF